MPNELDFDTWCGEIDQLGRNQQDLDFSLVRETGRASWQEAYDDGETPDHAFAEMMSYGD